MCGATSWQTQWRAVLASREVVRGKVSTKQTVRSPLVEAARLARQGECRSHNADPEFNRWAPSVPDIAFIIPPTKKIYDWTWLINALLFCRL